MHCFHQRHASWWVLIFVSVSFAVLGGMTNVPVRVTTSDARVLQSALKIRPNQAVLAYEEELALIKAVQHRLWALVPTGEGIPIGQPREPSDLLRRTSGLCYDRSRTLEKALSWLGFRTRHIYLFYREVPETGEPIPCWAFFTRAARSHAVTEVMTRRGWLLVDASAPWIAVTSAGVPVDAEHVPSQLRGLSNVPGYLQRKYVAIPGLYSRSGQLYPPYLPLPDVNWRDFLAGLWTRCAEALT